jgi:hypothetical protein
MDATARLGQRELAMIAAQDEFVRPARHFAVTKVGMESAA